jgi:hypothetical protein
VAGDRFGCRNLLNKKSGSGSPRDDRHKTHQNRRRFLPSILMWLMTRVPSRWSWTEKSVFKGFLWKHSFYNSATKRLAPHWASLFPRKILFHPLSMEDAFLVHTLVRMSTEIVALCLQQVGRQRFSPVAVVIR